ncbi:ABC transporter substrate-binding protein [Kitasatospora phosalacinea]|uniref:ABC transporter substrate-binding protein n=1 Tax=Kitasatospora phosalacinea TaxID=2065 RepID=UPI000524A23E|nr:extracellular solute-binding protein [Kitasatospora phosalacinea]
MLAAAVALLSVAGCSSAGSGASTDGKTTIKIAVWNYASTPEFKALIDGFEATHPDIQVEPVDILADKYPDKLTTMLAGGDTTDVLTMKNVIDYSRYASRGQLAPLTDYVAQLDRPSYKNLTAYDINGEYYALPYRNDFWVLFYNKAMTGNADLSHLTWSGFSSLAKQLTSGDGANKVYGTYLHTWRSVEQALAAAQTDGNLLGGDYGFFKKQYELALDLQKSGAALPYSTATSQKVTYDSQLTTHKAATVPMGTWWAAALLAEKAKGTNDVDWGMAPVPQTTDGGKTTTFGSPTAFAINKKARHADAAKQFVQWASGPEGAAAIAKIGIVPSYSDSTIMKAFFSVPGMPNDELSRKAMQPDTVVLEMPVSERSSDVDQILTEEHQLVMSGQKSVDQGIQEMNKRVTNEVK